MPSNYRIPLVRIYHQLLPLPLSIFSGLEQFAFAVLAGREDAKVLGEKTYSPGKAFVVYEINRHVYIVSAFLPFRRDASLVRVELPFQLHHHRLPHLFISSKFTQRSMYVQPTFYTLQVRHQGRVCVCVFCSSLYCSLDWFSHWLLS
jgi:hypothetical protein